MKDFYLHSDFCWQVLLILIALKTITMSPSPLLPTSTATYWDNINLNDRVCSERRNLVSRRRHNSHYKTIKGSCAGDATRAIDLVVWWWPKLAYSSPWSDRLGSHFWGYRRAKVFKHCSRTLEGSEAAIREEIVAIHLDPLKKEMENLWMYCMTVYNISHCTNLVFSCTTTNVQCNLLYKYEWSRSKCKSRTLSFY